MSKIRKPQLAVIGFVFLILIMWFVNRSIENQLKETIRDPVPIPAKISEKPAAAPEGKVVRKSYIDPSRLFVENIFYQGETEIARNKNAAEKIYDETGEIPDGPVEFLDSGRNSYGEEAYKFGVRHGNFKEFYANGKLRREAYYQSGVLLKNKEYFIDGKLHLEEDYSDAMPSAENKEVGEGKVYYRLGMLKYEWKLTNNSDGRYTRAYNTEGGLMDEKYFDKDGKRIKPLMSAPITAAP